MARVGSGRATRSHDTLALLLRRVDYAESDLVVTLLSETVGRVSALARGARKSQRRFGGTLEPMHTLRVCMDERPHAELFTLRETKIETPRTSLVTKLDRLEVAGRALGWVRRASPPRTPEPEVWKVAMGLLDALDDAGNDRSARLLLAEAGLRILVAFGWGLDFDRCVACGKPYEDGRSVTLNVARGGVVCASCQGTGIRIGAELRGRLSSGTRGAPGALREEDAAAALDLVERSLRTHAGFD